MEEIRYATHEELAPIIDEVNERFKGAWERLAKYDQGEENNEEKISPRQDSEDLQEIQRTVFPEGN